MTICNRARYLFASYYRPENGRRPAKSFALTTSNSCSEHFIKSYKSYMDRSHTEIFGSILFLITMHIVFPVWCIAAAAGSWGGKERGARVLVHPTANPDGTEKAFAPLICAKIFLIVTFDNRNIANLSVYEW